SPDGGGAPAAPDPFTRANPTLLPEIGSISDSKLQTTGASGEDVTIDLSQKVALVFVRAWEELITSAEDWELREVALGGADTTARTKTLCQLYVEAAPEGVTPAKARSFALYYKIAPDALISLLNPAPSPRGTLQARVMGSGDGAATNPCVIAADSRY